MTLCLSLLLFYLTLFHLSEEAEDDLEDAITGKTESVQYDHPSHTVTVTTISELDLSGAHLLGPADNPVNTLNPQFVAAMCVLNQPNLCQSYCS